MAIHLLLDEHISPDVAEALRRHRPRLHAVPMRDWHDGIYLGIPDDVLLTVACQERLTLVTYDQRTIVPLIKRMADAGVPHGGVILIDGRTVSPSDIGGLTRGLVAIWETMRSVDWTNRVIYLTQ